jgi:hypothetical protein
LLKAVVIEASVVPVASPSKKTIDCPGLRFVTPRMETADANEFEY